MATFQSVIVTGNKHCVQTKNEPVGNKKRVKKDVAHDTTPTKIAITRRNARERNRVKQVNNGFLTLRQHIPTDIAAAYENSTGRNNNKKLSKVETLRMAVEYIRSLKEILSNDSNIVRAEDTSSTYQQYVLIPDTNDTYKFDYEDEENIQPVSEPIEVSSTTLPEKGFDGNNILYSSIGSPYSSNKNSVYSPGDYVADGLVHTKQFHVLPPIEVLHPRSVFQNNIAMQPSAVSSVNNFTLLHQTSESLSNSSMNSCDSSDFIKSETLSDHSDFHFQYSDVKTEEDTIDVMDWWENHSKLTVIES